MVLEVFLDVVDTDQGRDPEETTGYTLWTPVDDPGLHVSVIVDTLGELVIPSLWLPIYKRGS